MSLTVSRAKIKPRKASSKTAEAERINTFLPKIVAVFKPDSPLKAQPDGSTRVGNKGALVLGPEAGLWYDYEASVGGRTAHTLLKHLGVKSIPQFIRKFLADHRGNGAMGLTSSEDSNSLNEASKLTVAYFSDQTQPVINTPAEKYLQNRGIEAPYPDSIGWVTQARAGEGAMIAIVKGPDGPAAIQLTYVTPAGNKSSIEPQRRTYVAQDSWQSGGGFTITNADAPERTVIAEGIEDALSLSQAKVGATIIASLGLSNLGKAPVDLGVPVIVFRDGDDPDSPAEKGLATGVDRLILQGASVTITDTPLGSDANALLQSDGPGALLKLVENAEPAELSVDGHVQQCADLSHTEYEEIRTTLAKELGIRVSFLDKQVNVHRRHGEDQHTSENSLGIEDIEPWPDPVNLAEVLDESVRLLSQYIAADLSLIHTAVLWAAHTHNLNMINVSPRLAVQAAGPGCGKTVAMEAISNLVPRPLTASSITAAVVFRVIEDFQPTLLLDEADQILADRSSPLVAILNSSHRKSSAYVLRTEEVLPGQFVPVRFSTWAAIMFAGIRELPPTLQDRCIVLYLRRAKPGEVKEHLRDGTCDGLAECAQKLARWAGDLETLPDVKLPPILSNRIGDNWRPLLAIAELAGDDWPTLAMDAAEAAAEQHDQGLISTLLGDIAQVFGERQQMLSQEIVDGLIGFDEKPYGELNRGRAITTHWLARQLKGVTSKSTHTIRVGNARKKGYSRDAFADAWERYGISATTNSVPKTPPKTTVPNVTTGQPLPDKGSSVTDGARVEANVTDGNQDVTEASRLPDGSKPNATADCHGVTDDTVVLGGISEALPEEPVSTVQEEDSCLI